MYPINRIPPDRMTPEQRRREVASLLANGARLRDSGVAQCEDAASESEFELAILPERSVHKVSNQSGRKENR